VSVQDGNFSRKNSLRAEARRQRKQRPRKIALVLLVVLAAMAAYARTLFQPAAEAHRPEKVEVPEGSGVARIGDILEREGIIRSALAFHFYVRWHGAGRRLKPGHYTLSGDMSLAQILLQLKAGPGKSGDDRIRVTVPEGYTLKQIASTLREKDVTDDKAFLKLAADPGAFSAFDLGFTLPKESLEGYLFPDTYEFLPHTPAAQVVEEMLMNFGRRFARPKQQEIVASGRGLNDVVTLASLIEREAKVPEDRPRIAGVLDNRLKHDMRLEVDATVLYALGHHKGHVLYKDLRVDSPYNTYRNKGLPPGPIANPGLPSLEAALHPEKNDYLYYLAQPGGAHLFSRTRAEHEAAIRKVRSERKTGANAEGPTIGE
jgi:UPF0755 protein